MATMRVVGAEPGKRILFRREFGQLTGGHLKVWHYFQHALCAPGWTASIYLMETDACRSPSPWSAVSGHLEQVWDPEGADALFVAGMDWLAVPDSCRKPVINLVQGVRHSVPGDPRRQFLGRPAVRLCVSPQVSEAILATGFVNGPVITIPNGLEASELPAPSGDRDIPVLVVGYKDVELARSVCDELARRGVPAHCVLHVVPRMEFLELLARAEFVVTIPREQEGFYLPALEAMALGAIVVCPDCTGNRCFCTDGDNCLMPDRSTRAIVQCIEAAVRMPGPTRSRMLDRARETARSMDIAHERTAFHRVLAQVASSLTQ
jgi:hypothetical protein